MDIRENIQFLKGVGPKKAQALKKLGIEKIYDLITYYPRRYEDQSQIVPIGRIKVGEVVNIQGKIMAMAEKNTRRGLKLLTIMLADDTGVVQLNFFNQDYLKKKLKVQKSSLFVHGKVGYAYGGYGQLAISQIISFDVINNDNIDSEENINPCAFMPIYTIPDYIKPKDFRNLIEQVCTQDILVKDVVPNFIREKYDLWDKQTAIKKIHFPQTRQELEKAKKSLIFEELFLIQAGLLLLN